MRCYSFDDEIANRFAFSFDFHLHSCNCGLSQEIPLQRHQILMCNLHLAYKKTVYV